MHYARTHALFAAIYMLLLRPILKLQRRLSKDHLDSFQRFDFPRFDVLGDQKGVGIDRVGHPPGPRQNGFPGKVELQLDHESGLHGSSIGSSRAATTTTSSSSTTTTTNSRTLLVFVLFRRQDPGVVLCDERSQIFQVVHEPIATGKPNKRVRKVTVWVVELGVHVPAQEIGAIVVVLDASDGFRERTGGFVRVYNKIGIGSGCRTFFAAVAFVSGSPKGFSKELHGVPGRFRNNVHVFFGSGRVSFVVAVIAAAIAPNASLFCCCCPTIAIAIAIYSASKYKLLLKGCSGRHSQQQQTRRDCQQN